MALALLHGSTPCSIGTLHASFAPHGLHAVYEDGKLIETVAVENGFLCMNRDPKSPLVRDESFPHAEAFCIDSSGAASAHAMRNGELRWQARDGTWTAKFFGKPVRALALCGDGSKLAVCFADGRAFLFEGGFAESAPAASRVRSVALSFDGRVSATVDESNSIKITHPTSVLGMNEDERVNAVALNYDGSRAALLFSDHVRVVDTAFGELMAKAPFVDATPEHELAFSAEGGRYLVAWHPTQHTAAVWQIW